MYSHDLFPLIIGIILGPFLENNLRKSLCMFKGDISSIVDRPTAMIFLSLAAAPSVYKILRNVFWAKRGPAALEPGD